MDGKWDDWQSAAITQQDPVGDATSKLDLTQVDVTMRGATLHARLTFDQPLNLQSGPESDGTLRMTIGLPPTESEFDRRLNLDFRLRQAMLMSERKAATAISWPELSFVAAPTFASRQIEMQCNLSPVNVAPGDVISVAFDQGDQLNDLMRLEVPKPMVVTPESVAIPDTEPQATRIISFNTLHQGTCDPFRGPVLARMIEQMQPDIICFNEEWEADLFQSGLGRVIPNVDEMQTHWHNGCAIATKGQCTPVPLDLPRAAVAVITLPDRDPLLVVSIHLKCCGYLGSEEDIQRIETMNALTQKIQSLRRGDLGDEYRELPVVVLGDFNLVGSDVPLSCLLDAGLSEVLPRSLIDQSTSTWAAVDPAETFWPGRLDCIAVDQSRLEVLRSFLFDRVAFRQTNPDWQGESVASDHAALVLDVVLATLD
ncbi:MAG: endonuclease/exonuclease/phosphatase family protein [Planctomycetota bacterium]